MEKPVFDTLLEKNYSVLAARNYHQTMRSLTFLARVVIELQDAKTETKKMISEEFGFFLSLLIRVTHKSGMLNSDFFMPDAFVTIGDLTNPSHLSDLSTENIESIVNEFCNHFNYDSTMKRQPEFTIGTFLYSPSQAIICEGKKVVVSLSRNENNLFQLLYSSTNRSIDAETLQAVTKGGSWTNDTLRVQICSLRKKLSPMLKELEIVTDRSHGYFLKINN